MSKLNEKECWLCIAAMDLSGYDSYIQPSTLLHIKDGGKYCECEAVVSVHDFIHPHKVSFIVGRDWNCKGFQLLEIKQVIL